MKRTILAVLMCLICSPVFAAPTYYINYGGSGASDSNTATQAQSMSTPWNTCTPIQGNNFLPAGSTVSIYYLNHFIGTDAHCNFASAGNSANHITVNSYGGSTTSSGLTITVTESGGVITGGTIAAAGTGYFAGQVVYVGAYNATTSGSNGEFTVATVSAGVPQTITLLNGGLLYSAATYATTNPKPIFDGGVNATSVAGWTGWTLSQTGYDFNTSTSGISTGCVYTNNSKSFTVTGEVQIGGSYQLVTTGTGAPTSTGNLTYSSGSGTCTSPITYTAVQTNPIYVTQTTIPFAVSNVSVDGAYSLRRMNNGGGQTVNTMNFEQNSYYQTGSGQLLYLQLADGSSPASHTIEFGEYGPSFGGLIETDATISAYIDFYNLIAQNAYNFGFETYAPYTTTNGMVSQFNGREGLYYAANDNTNGTGSTHSTDNGSLSQYNNGYFTGSAGQGITIESSYFTGNGTTSQYNWMAGIDWLNYSSTTNAVYGKCIGCISHDNGYRAWQFDPGGYDPAGFYLDGASNIQLINPVVYMSSPYNGFDTSNSIFGISIGDEHPSTYIVKNIDIINGLIEGINFADINMGAINCTGAGCNVFDNVRIIGTTLGSSGQQLLYTGGWISGGIGLTLENNIYYNNRNATTGNSPCYNSSGTQVCNLVSDYNTYYNTVSGNKIWDESYEDSHYTLSSWQSLSGEDAHSQYANPLVTTGTPPNSLIPGGFFLSSTSSGQGSNSPALAVALANALGTQYIYSSIGTVLTNLTTDSIATPAEGYHYYATLLSSSFDCIGTGGSDIGSSAC